MPTLDYLTKALLGSASVEMMMSMNSTTNSATSGVSAEEKNGGAADWSAPEYEAAMKRALKIPTCPIVPFFGAYLRELRTVLNTPSLIVLSSGSEHHQLQPLSDPDADDDYFTKIGTGSLLSMKKLRKVQSIFERITVVHQHHAKRQQKTAFLNADRLSIHTSSIERSGYPDDEDSQDSSDEFYCHKSDGGGGSLEDSGNRVSIYEPVQPISHDPEVSFIPFDSSRNSIDLHTLQALHHGCTAIHLDSDGRSAFVWVKLEKSCGTITWSKPVWSSLRFSHAQPDFLLNVDPETLPVLPGLLMKYGGGPGSGSGGVGLSGPAGLGPDVATVGPEEGYVDLNGVKEVEVGSRDIDVNPAMKRFGVESWPVQESCISLVFGMGLSDNRYTAFVFPPRMAAVWLNGKFNLWLT